MSRTRWLRLDLTLRQDVVQSQDASTEGPHVSLDYIRGSNLLGVAASRAYRELQRLGLAYDAFHSGRVRFLDAIPCVGATTAVPIPFGWLAPKQAELARQGLDGLRIHSDSGIRVGAYADRGADARDEGESVEQIRRGHFTADGRLGYVEQSYRLKTAVDRGARGAPARGALFGYAAIPAGTRMHAWIGLDGDVDRAVDAALTRAFRRKGPIWVGASRGAEYGRVAVQVSPGGSPPWLGRWAPPGSAPSDPDATDRVVVMAVSDLALRDEATGAATWVPTAEVFGLPGGSADDAWVLDPVSSAVMTGQGSPFNGKRRCRDLERPVIRRRSVLTFRPRDGQPRAVDWHRLRGAVARGVGRHRAEGLGQIWVHPWFLAEPDPTARWASADAGPVVARPKAVEPPRHPLAEWMLRRAGQQATDEAARAVAVGACERLGRFVAVLDQTLDPDAPRPTRTQWNRLARVADEHRDVPLTTVVPAIWAAAFTGRVGAEAWSGSQGWWTLGHEVVWRGLHLDGAGWSKHDLRVALGEADPGSAGPPRLVEPTIEGVPRLVALRTLARMMSVRQSRWRGE